MADDLMATNRRLFILSFLGLLSHRYSVEVRQKLSVFYKMNQEINKGQRQLPGRHSLWPKNFSLKQTFSALKYPNYRRWFWGQMTSVFGTWMQSTAQAFLIYELTHSAAYLGYVGFAAGLPTLIFMLVAGVMADRIPRRRILIITQSAMMILAFTLAALSFLQLIRPWHIILLALATGVATAFDAPARQAFVLEMVDRETLTNAIALNSAMFNTAQALGPAAGGLIYAALGPAWCFTINGLSFLAVIYALHSMKLKPLTLLPAANSVIADLKEGINYVLKHPRIRTIILTVGATTLFGRSFITLFPAWAVEILHGNATTNGWLQASYGLGALTGALFLASVSNSINRGRILRLELLFCPVFIISFALARSVSLSLFLALISGANIIMLFNSCNALVQIETPENMRGRVMGIYSFVFFSLMPFGALWMGGMAHLTGVKLPVLVAALGSLVYGLSLFIFNRQLLKLR
ncbi:MAG: MFS transporter [Candidatus Saccharicenans sp.]|jgi:MFS family permease|nr:MFS transporter [Candidatus Saccharicenans sp.]